MPRLFVAIWPPEEVLEQLAALDRPEVDGLRWTDRPQWHVTLRFLGQVADVAPVSEALSTVDAAATTARLGPALARFGQRILHVPVAGADSIAAGVVAATAGLGRPPDDRPFHGHVTLARSAKHARVDLRPLTGRSVAARWVAGSLCLVESRLSPAGARYTVVQEFPLRPPVQPEAGAAEPVPPQGGGRRRTS